MATTMASNFANPPVSAPNQHPYTCNTCQVAFKGSDLQRSHMQSDWHRYNLKRRVASLPPLTSEIFAEKVLANQASAAATAARASFEKICTVCQRTYFSENAYQNHLGSQKHRTKLAQIAAAPPSTLGDDETSSMMSSAFSLGEPIEAAKPPADIEDPAVEEEFSKVVDSLKQTSLDGEDPLPGRPSRPVHPAQTPRPEHPLSPIKPTDASSTPDGASTSDETEGEDATLKCLFCNTPSPSIESNVIHMQSKHGMFVPEQAYLVDLKGLVSWLFDRVHALHECLYCGTIKHTTSGIQTHMRDKGHCMIAFESESDMIEVGQFYDFRASYSDTEDSSEESSSDDEDEAPAHDIAKLGAKRSATYVADGDEETEDYDDGEWESDEDDETHEEDNDAKSDTTETPLPSQSQSQAYAEDYELHLPSGRTAGHRSLARYYRQNLHNYPTPSERAARLLVIDGEANPAEERGRRSQALITRANGGMGLAGAPESKKKEAAAGEVRERKRQQRIEKRMQWGNDRQGNSQKHFRDPLLQ